MSEYARRPIPMLPKLAPRSTWEEMARAYGTMAEALYEKWGETAKDADEGKAAALTASAVAHRAELAAQRAENATNELRTLLEPLRADVSTLKTAINRLTARLNGEEIETRAREASRPAVEEIAGAVAEEVREKLEEVTGRFNIPAIPPTPTLDSERVKAIVEGERRSQRLKIYDALSSNVAGWILKVAGIGSLFLLERAIEAVIRHHW